MSKPKAGHVLKRFTAFVMAFCCLFSMFPAVAGAADEAEGSGSSDMDYRYIWLISQPGLQLKIMEKNEKKVLYAKNMDANEWLPMKQTQNDDGEWIYVVDPTSQEYADYKMPSPNNPEYTSDPLNLPNPEAGFLRLISNFNQTTDPHPDAWPDAKFAYNPGMLRSFNPNQIDETNNGNREWWAGNKEGYSNAITYPNNTDWQKCIDKSPNAGGDYFPSTLWSEPVQSFGPENTPYLAQIQVRVEDVADYFIDGWTERIVYPNNSMFQFISTEKIGEPNFETRGTVIFDFNLPGYPATIEYLEDAGTMVSVPGISTREVDGVTFTFKGWYDRPEGGTKLTASQVEVPKGKYDIYYAQWDLYVPPIPVPELGEGDMYVVYFDYNLEGTGVTSAYCAAGTFTWTVTVDGEEKEYTAKLPFQFPEDPRREGYTFHGWATESDATVPNVADGWVPEKSGDTLYGVWTANIYNLTWNANGGSGGTTTQQRYDETITPPPTEPTREGYTFAGWYLDSNCSAPLASGTTVTGDQTFYAKWVSEKVKVSYYDTRQGTGLVETQTYNYGDKLNPLAPLEDTDGWHFVRWETKNGQSADSIGNLTSAVLDYHKGSNGGNVASDAGYWTLDLYAVWAQDTVDFTATVRWDDFQNNDGCRPQSVKLGLVSSINDELVSEATVQNDGNVE